MSLRMVGDQIGTYSDSPADLLQRLVLARSSYVLVSVLACLFLKKN